MLIHEAPWGAAFTIQGVPLIAKNGSDYLANPTLASGDVKVSKDGGAFTNLATLPDAEPDSGKAVRVQLSAAEMECTFAVIDFIDQTNPKEWEDQRVIVVTELLRGAEAGSVISGTNSATAFDTNLAGADDVHIRKLLTFTTGALARQVREVDDFADTNGRVTVTEAFTGTPANGDKFVVSNR
jgi:hypothetical protein